MDLFIYAIYIENPRNRPTFAAPVTLCYGVVLSAALLLCNGRLLHRRLHYYVLAWILGSSMTSRVQVEGKAPKQPLIYWCEAVVFAMTKRSVTAPSSFSKHGRTRTYFLKEARYGNK